MDGSDDCYKFCTDKVGEAVAKEYNNFMDVTYGSYEITGQKEDLIIDPAVRRA